MPVVEGDPFGGIKEEQGPSGPSPREINEFHKRSDVDSSVTAQHHTLGIKHDQASPGDHVHDGKGSRKIGVGVGLNVTGSKAGNAALASLITELAKVIDFTDATT